MTHISNNYVGYYYWVGHIPYLNSLPSALSIRHDPITCCIKLIGGNLEHMIPAHDISDEDVSFLILAGYRGVYITPIPCRNHYLLNSRDNELVTDLYYDYFR